MNIESMDMFNCLYIDEYICQSRSKTILYSILVLFAVVESNCQCKRDWKTLNGDLLQPFEIRYDSRSFSFRYFVSFTYGKGLISAVYLFVVVHPKPQEVSLRNRIGDHTGEVPSCFFFGVGGTMCLIFLTCSLFLPISMSYLVVC